MGSVQICNTSKETIVLPRRTYNVLGWRIPPCPEDKPFSSIVIDDQMDVKKVYTEYDENKAEKIPVPVPVAQVVADYTANERLLQRGCFVIDAGQIPTEAQVNMARETRTKWLQMLVEAGDKEYARTKRVDEIPDYCKNAVAELHLKREWCITAPKKQKECPACGELINESAAVCKTCKAILDPERAKTFGIAEAGAPEAPKRRGRKPKAKVEEQPKELGGI